MLSHTSEIKESPLDKPILMLPEIKLAKSKEDLTKLPVSPTLLPVTVTNKLNSYKNNLSPLLLTLQTGAYTNPVSSPTVLLD